MFLCFSAFKLENGEYFCDTFAKKWFVNEPIETP